jgi:hypothetical protein
MEIGEKVIWGHLEERNLDKSGKSEKNFDWPKEVLFPVATGFHFRIGRNFSSVLF